MNSGGLTREEECTLKTALAFVVIKSRMYKALEDPETSTPTSEQQEDKNQKDCTGNGILLKGRQPSSTLDRLFDSSPANTPLARRETNSAKQHHGIIHQTPRAARKTSFMQSLGDEGHLSKIFHAACSLARSQDKASGGRSDACPRNEVALFGAVGHLANQLQIILICKTPLICSAPAKTANIEAEDEKQSDGTVSSKGIVVAPDAFVQEWIRSKLLEVLDNGDGFHNNKRSMLAAFCVFQVMVPQLVDLSPALLGHIFQVATKILRDLYDDKITIANGPHERPAECKGILDFLATSALRLMECCWTSKAMSSRDNKGRKNHLEFMAKELQYRLGDLIVPVPLQQIPHVYRNLCNSQKLHNHHQRMLFRVGTRMSRRSCAAVSPLPHTWNKRMRKLPTFTLDPGAKLIIQMSIYRLLIQA
jgi:hypothetical protein